jgi:hypothetical protein
MTQSVGQGIFAGALPCFVSKTGVENHEDAGSNLCHEKLVDLTDCAAVYYDEWPRVVVVQARPRQVARFTINL